jgi:hypothetical protein
MSAQFRVPSPWNWNLCRPYSLCWYLCSASRSLTMKLKAMLLIELVLTPVLSFAFPDHGIESYVVPTACVDTCFQLRVPWPWNWKLSHSYSLCWHLNESSASRSVTMELKAMSFIELVLTCAWWKNKSLSMPGIESRLPNQCAQLPAYAVLHWRCICMFYTTLCNLETVKKLMRTVDSLHLMWNIVLSLVWVTIDGIWIGDCISWTFTDRK